jgi:pimeloyl-ACP methyl ester carboxylesterase
MFRPTDDAALKGRLLDDMASLPQRVLQPAITSYFGWTAESAASKVVAPVLLITFGDGPPSDIVRFRELYPNAEVGRAVGAGHFAHMIVPEQVNAMIDAFLVRTVPAALAV